MEIKNEHLLNYYTHGYWNIHGWVHKQIFEFFQVFDDMEINKDGGVCEIGAHFGKFYFLMNTMVQPEFQSYAVDIFDDQTLNVSKSGGGNLEKFKNYLSSYDRHRGDNTNIITGDSTDPALNLCDHITPGSIKIFSVDGGHYSQHAMNDLMIADKLINNQGIVILDDILNVKYLGVLESAIQLVKSKSTLIPFGIGYNKLFLARPSYYQHYKTHFSNSEICKQQIEFFGHAIPYFGYIEPLA